MSLFTCQKYAHSYTEIHCALDKLESPMLTVVTDEYLIRKLSKVSKECTANTDTCCYTIHVVAIDFPSMSL